MRIRTMNAVLALAVALFGTQGAVGQEPFVGGTGIHGLHGLTMGADGYLYVGSVVGQSLYRVDPDTGETTQWQAPPTGMADDLEFGPDGSLAWTSIILGKVHARTGDGEVIELASGLPGTNSIAFNEEGRLFVGLVFLGDALYELDPRGEKEPRKILENIGGLNGFDFGPDGYLYGPLWFKGQVVRVDVDSGELSVVAEGFTTPAAANFNSKGELFVLDTGSGKIVRVDVDSGEQHVVAELRTALDNLCFDAGDRLFVTVMAESAIYEIDTETGEARTVREGPLSVPADLLVDGDTLYVADTFALKAVDLGTGAVRSLGRQGEIDFEYPNGLDIQGDVLYTASWFGSMVQKFNKETGARLGTFHELPTAFDVVAEGDGSFLALLMFPGQIVRVNEGEPEKREVVARGLTTGTSMIRDGRGGLFVSLYAPGQIVHVDLETGEVLPVVDGLSRPEGLVMLRDGRLAVAEAGADRVRIVDPATGTMERLPGDFPMQIDSVQGFPPMGVMSGVAADSAGRVYVSSDVNSAIYQVKLAE